MDNNTNTIVIQSNPQTLSTQQATVIVQAPSSVSMSSIPLTTSQAHIVEMVQDGLGAGMVSRMYPNMEVTTEAGPYVPKRTFSTRVEEDAGNDNNNDNGSSSSKKLKESPGSEEKVADKKEETEAKPKEETQATS